MGAAAVAGDAVLLPGRSPVMMPSRSVPMRVHSSKIVVPELPGEFTPRPALRRRLDEAGADQVIVVIAPAGSGKTLMLADWVRSDDGPETAWISLDSDDNDPRRLWSAVLASVLSLPSMAGHAQRDDRDAVPTEHADQVEA